MKTSVLLKQNLRTYAQRSLMYCDSQSAASLSSYKIVFEKHLHFLHHVTAYPVFTNEIT